MCSTSRACSAPAGSPTSCRSRAEAGEAPRARPARGAAADPLVTEDEVMATECLVAEGYVSGPGARTVLGFDLAVQNTGRAALAAGGPPAAGIGNAIYTWEECFGARHEHDDFLRFRLLDSAGTVVTEQLVDVPCLQDHKRFDPEAAESVFSECSGQRISPGHLTIIPGDLEGFWLDVTDVLAGDYTLEIEVNASGTFAGSDTSNNVISVPVVIEGVSGGPSPSSSSSCAITDRPAGVGTMLVVLGLAVVWGLGVWAGCSRDRRF